MIDINDYCHFVRSTTSQPSLDVRDFSGKMYELNNWFVSPQILTAVIGMQSETGEFAEIVKKIIFQGKEMSQDQRYHMMRELGDIIWYWCQGCMALGYTPEEVIAENIKKLESRYPNGFEVFRSENRKEGDL